jgi:spore coat protein CotH
MYGSYVHLEEIDTDFAENHWPLDPNGNVYRGTRDGQGGTLTYRGTNVNNYANNGYTKQSNVSENDWSDLINLTFVLNNTPDSEYVGAMRQTVNVEEWIKYFAMMVMTGVWRNIDRQRWRRRRLLDVSRHQ